MRRWHSDIPTATGRTVQLEIVQAADGTLGGFAFESDAATRHRCRSSRQACGVPYYYGSLGGTQDVRTRQFSLSGTVSVIPGANGAATHQVPAEFRGTFPSGNTAGSVEMIRDGQTFAGPLVQTTN